jgi:hypothetical protein
MLLRVPQINLNGDIYEPAHKEDLCVPVSISTASTGLESLPPTQISNTRKSVRLPLPQQSDIVDRIASNRAHVDTHK